MVQEEHSGIGRQVLQETTIDMCDRNRVYTLTLLGDRNQRKLTPHNKNTRGKKEQSLMKSFYGFSVLKVIESFQA